MNKVEVHRNNQSNLPERINRLFGTETLAPGSWPPASNLFDSRSRWNANAAAWRTGDFFKHLPHEAIHAFESVAAPYSCSPSKILLSEGEAPAMALFLLEGQVKITLNSIDGRRLILGMAGPGEVLGLSGIVSGSPYHITAEAQSPCKLTSMPRRVFLDFLLRYPLAGQNVGLQLSHEYTRACEQLRTLGIRMTSGTRLARLLLKWCADGMQTDTGMRIKCSLTHTEIGECIGVARETVSRTLTEFRLRQLVEQRGSTLIVSNIRALENYADHNCA